MTIKMERGRARNKIVDEAQSMSELTPSDYHFWNQNVLEGTILFFWNQYSNIVRKKLSN